MSDPFGPCPAGGDHTFDKVEVYGIGRKAVACVECGAKERFDATSDELEAEALEDEARCSGCQAWIPPHRDLCIACEDADERAWGGDAA